MTFLFGGEIDQKMSGEKIELRGPADADLVRALDALAYAKNMSRTDYINKVLATHVDSCFHEIRIVTNMCRGNPLLKEDSGKAME